MILVDYSTEHRPSPDIARTNHYRIDSSRVRHGKGKASVLARSVVMLHVGPKDPSEVAANQHEHAVQALGPDGFNPSLGVSVRLRGAFAQLALVI